MRMLRRIYGVIKQDTITNERITGGDSGGNFKEST